MLYHSTASLLAVTCLVAGPAMAQTQVPVQPAPQPQAIEAAAPAAPLGDEAETDIEIINGIPVNPELKARIMESEDARSVNDLIDLTNQVLRDQQEQLAEQERQSDTSWMGEDPLGHLEGEMSQLVGQIGQSQTGEGTQAQGKDVVRKMDTLIAMMEKACSACSSCAGGQGQKPGNKPGNKPAQDSTLAQGPGGIGDLSATAEGNNTFGELDPQQRDAILRAQSDQQGFGSEYDELLAEYYARLAAEQALDAPEPADNDAAE